MSIEPTTRTITLTGPSLVPSGQPDWPVSESVPDGLDAGLAPSASNREVRCVMCLLLA
jgi:hypothetical protein